MYVMFNFRWPCEIKLSSILQRKRCNFNFKNRFSFLCQNRYNRWGRHQRHLLQQHSLDYLSLLTQRANTKRTRERESDGLFFSYLQIRIIKLWGEKKKFWILCFLGKRILRQMHQSGISKTHFCITRPIWNCNANHTPAST